MVANIFLSYNPGEKKMQLNNPLQMNDWGIKKFLTVVLAIQFAMWGAIGLDVMGLKIPILREFVGFIYLTFIPGIILLRILKLHKLGNIETLLYTVGLSIATLMFTGLFMNTVYPVFGIYRPISLTFLIITISIIVLLLCILSYVRDKDFSDPSFVDSEDILSPPALFLCLIPFLAVFGTYLVNFYYNNILLMFLIVILAIIVLLIAFDKFIPQNLYPLAVFIIATSLLLHRSLISMYITGWDIQFEHYLGNLVKMNSIWDPTIPNNCNAMLSVVMLPPIYSIVSDMSIVWVFKIIYPLLFSLVPLGLYRVFQKQTDDKIAFLSCFFFVSLFTFYGEMLALARQQIAELFLVLLILLMIDKNMDKMKKALLFIVFGASLVVSHYGTSYLYMFCLISAWLILVLMNSPSIKKLKDNIYAKYSTDVCYKISGKPISLKIENKTISSTFILLFIVFALTWYMYVSSSSAFDTIVHIGNHIASSIFTEFLNPEAAQGLYLIIGETLSPLHNVAKYLHLTTQFLIVVGALKLFLKREGVKLVDEYIAFSLVNLVICFCALAIPYFASALNTSRLYQITLVFLALFCVIGGITFFKLMSGVIKVPWTDHCIENSLKILSIFFAIFLLFNSGWVYELAKDHPTSISLNNTIDGPRFNELEVLGAKWLNGKKDSKSSVYGDQSGWLLLNGIIGFKNGRYNGDSKSLPNDAYIYLRSLIVKEGKITINEPSKYYIDLHNSTFFNEVLIHRNKIYANGGSEIYR